MTRLYTGPETTSCLKWNIMARNTSRSERIAERRRRVAALRLMGMTQREIADDVDVGLATVNRDLKALTEEWRAEALQDVGEHTAYVLAEIREARRQCWAEGDIDGVYKGLKQERDLLGLDAPKRVDVRHEMRQRAERLANRYGLDVADVLSEAEAIIRELQR